MDRVERLFCRIEHKNLGHRCFLLPTRASCFQGNAHLVNVPERFDVQDTEFTPRSV